MSFRSERNRVRNLYVSEYQLVNQISRSARNDNLLYFAEVYYSYFMEESVMKNYQTKVSTFILLVCIFSFGLFEVINGQQAEADYYIVDGKKVILQISQTYSAIKLKPEVSKDMIKAFKANIDSAGFGMVEESPLLEKYGIVLVRIQKDTATALFKAGIENLSKKDEVETGNPVYTAGGINQVLVNEFIVQFKSDASQESIEQSIKSNNAEIVKKDEKIKNRYILKFPGKTAREALTLSNAYHQDPLVEFSEPNFISIYPKRPKIKGTDIEEEDALTPSAAATPNDPLFSKQWALNNTGSSGHADADIDAPEGWEIHKGMDSIIVAIIDEGVDTQHKDLKDKIVSPYDATDGDNNQEPKSWDGHGTACAGIAAAMTDNDVGVSGVGWNVRIMPVRIAYSNYKNGPWITTNVITEDGIREAVNRGAQVLSNSWGGGSPSSAINSAIDFAIANNCVVVFAAGNCCSGSYSGCGPWAQCPRPVIYPANLSLSKVVIAVSATNEWDQFKTPNSFDGEKWWGSHSGEEVTVSAPGVHIYTTDISGSDGYASGDYISNFNGTSSATPFVAGAAALVLSQNPTWNPTQVRNQLQNTADDLGDSGFDEYFGYGRINVCNALGGSCTYDRKNGCCGALAVTVDSDHSRGDQLATVALNIGLFFVPVFIFKRRTKNKNLLTF